MKTENQKQDTKEVYLNQLIDEANKEFSLDRKLAKKVALKFAAWQAEKMYSQEEVLKQLNHLIRTPSSKLDKYTDDGEMLTMKWFEQFKKK